MAGQRGLPVALLLATLAGATAPELAGAAEAGPAPQGKAGQPPEGHKPRFGLKVSLEAAYDDNIIQLSEGDRQLLKDNTDPDRFRITTADDAVAEGNFDFRWSGHPIGERRTLVAASVDAHRYTRNSVKDYQEIALSISQEITASRSHLASIRLRVSRTPTFYLRQLTDDDASFAAGQRIREAATYAENEYALAYRQEIVDGRMEGRLGWGHRSRNFNDHFDERDGARREWSLVLTGRPSGRSPIEMSLEYETGALHARGDLPSSPIADDDVSYRFRAIVLGAGIPWKTDRRGRLEIDLRREWRDFTTANSFDTSHSGREDDRRDYRARLVQSLHSGLDLVAEIRRRSNDTALPAGFTASEEETDFVEDRVTVGLAWSHDF